MRREPEEMGHSLIFFGLGFLSMVFRNLLWVWSDIFGWNGMDLDGLEDSEMILQETPLTRVADPTHAPLTTMCAMF